MRRHRKTPKSKGERGVIILLVAIILLFVVGAMAVLAIDFVTFYTARSEAQIAADGAALAGARVMANSGSTSRPSAFIEALAHTLASNAATQVAAQNKVGGRNLNPAEVTVTFPPTIGTEYNPRVRVVVARNDLPTFFARIFGSAQVAVTATATAEAYNPSGNALALGAGGPIAPVCAKPWLLPNLDPTGSGNPIFNASGTIFNNSLSGQSWLLEDACDSCTGVLNKAAGKYFPAAIDPTGTDPQQFVEPTQSLPLAAAGLSSYQKGVAGCVPQPITCGLNANFKIDLNIYTPTSGIDRNTDTIDAAKVLIHDNGADGDSDSIDPLAVPSPPFQYLAGNANTVAGAAGQNILVSNSLVNVPVFKDQGAVTTSPVQVIGFLQLFLNPQGTTMTGTKINATIINMAGCGDLATGQPILGTGASAIPVRLVSNQ
ncbi:MAG: hypothetical protein HY010_08110 [Acidobacteria bacterium]|nr:hypothetical protein [Acidobacteriota bacterium]